MLICIAASIFPSCFKQTNAFFQRLDRITVAVFIVDDLLSILPSVAVLNSGFKRFRLFRLNKA